MANSLGWGAGGGVRVTFHHIAKGKWGDSVFHNVLLQVISPENEIWLGEGKAGNVKAEQVKSQSICERQAASSLLLTFEGMRKERKVEWAHWEKNPSGRTFRLPSHPIQEALIMEHHSLPRFLQQWEHDLSFAQVKRQPRYWTRLPVEVLVWRLVGCPCFFSPILNSVAPLFLKAPRLASFYHY